LSRWWRQRSGRGGLITRRRSVFGRRWSGQRWSGHRRPARGKPLAAKWWVRKIGAVFPNRGRFLRITAGTPLRSAALRAGRVVQRVTTSSRDEPPLPSGHQTGIP
jgi:hypothetical protein